jgi:hypothetical protein
LNTNLKDTDHGNNDILFAIVMSALQAFMTNG